MQHLSGLDNLFLTLEDNRQHMHVAALGLYDPSTALDGAVRFKEILDFFSSKINEVPFFRRRLVKAPLWLDRPYWIDDGEVDVEYHVRHIALPAPGDWRQLMIQIARLHARPLDLTRPLWEVYVIGGLDNIEGIAKGSFALYIKMHHAGVDGQAVAALIKLLHSTTPEYDLTHQSRVIYADREPSDLELVMLGLINRGKQAAEASKLVFQLGKKAVDLGSKYGEDVQKIVAEKLGLGDSQSAAKSRPKRGITRFDARLSPHRVVDAFGLSMEDFKTIRKNIDGVTINDIFLANTGGGLRKYFEAHHELPDTTVNALMPLAITGADKNSESSNNVTMITTPIFTNIADPIERLMEVKKSSTKGQQLQEDLGLSLVADVMNVIPSLAAVKLLQTGVLNTASLTISNVRGPDIPIYLAGAKMQMFIPVSIPFDGVGLNVTGFSCSGTLWVCMTACREMLPDPGFLSQCMKDSFDELLKGSAVWAKKNKVETSKSPVKSSAAKQKKVSPKIAAVKKAVTKKAN